MYQSTSVALRLRALDLTTSLCGILFPGLKHLVQENRVDDVRRPTQHTQFHNDKGQLIGEEYARREGRHGKEMRQIRERQRRQFFHGLGRGEGKQDLPSVVQHAQGRVGNIEHVTVRDQSEIGKHLAHWHGKYGTVLCWFWGWSLCVESVSLGRYR
jgi:hypothetical protein